MLTKEKITEIISFAGIEGTVTSVATPETGYRNKNYKVELKHIDDGRKQVCKTINIILYKNEPGIVSKIRLANAIGKSLDKDKSWETPVRTALTSRIIRLNLKSGVESITIGPQERYIGVYNYLEGATINWESYTREKIKDMGRVLAQLHRKLEGFNASDYDLIKSQSADFERAIDYFSRDDVRKAITDKLSLKIEKLVDVSKLVGQLEKLRGREMRWLHMDFVRSNILFDVGAAARSEAAVSNEGNKIIGIIDFEKAGYGPRVFDIARTLAFLTVDCKYKTSEKVYKYFVKSGYQKRGGEHLQQQELATLPLLVNLYWVYDLYKFLKHNPYESLAENEHYTRTRDLLIRSGFAKIVAHG